MTNRASAIPLLEQQWFDRLRVERQRRRVSRKALSKACGLSYETVRAYEFGWRGPKRETLERIVRVLDLSPAQANAILRSAGFSIDPVIERIDFPELREFGEQVPWPQAIHTEDLHMISINSLLQKLIRNYHFHTLRESERHALVGMIHPDRMRSIANWEEVMSFTISLWKNAVGEELPKEYSWWSALAELLSNLSRLERKRFYELWDKTPPLSTHVRRDCIMVWRDADFGDMRFRIVNGSSKQYPDLLIHDLCPIDADTWRKLELVRER